MIYGLHPRAGLALCICAVVLLTGCGEKKRARISVPPLPPPARTETATIQPPGRPPVTPSTKPAPQIEIPPDAKPLYVEEGYASWYGPPYHNRRGANGEVYDMHALTAAHRTLPMGSVVRVTNLKTNSVAVVRITDRGPFVTDRIIDLSLTAAKALDVWRPGTALVRVEVMQAPRDIEGDDGRWCVQIGSISDADTAAELADKLAHRYKSAKVLKFSGPMGDWWVRVRVKDDTKKRAEEVARDNHTPEGDIFLVRLD